MVKKISSRLPAGRAGEGSVRDSRPNDGRTASADPAAIRPGDAVAAVVPVKPGMRFDDPWLRAVMMTPSLHAAMTVSSYGDPDYAELRSLMGKPGGTVVMGFGGEPYPGLDSHRFSGGAVVFLATVSFRTAALR